MKSKHLILILSAILALLLSIFAFLILKEKQSNPNTAEQEACFEEVVVSLFSSEEVDLDVAQSMITGLEAGDSENYSDALGEIDTSASVSIEDLYIRGNRAGTAPYRGIFINDVRDARQVLANIDAVKNVGIDTLLVNIHYSVHAATGELYISAEEVYRFYINAFNKSGFRVWIAMANSSYDFPYASWSDNERIGIAPLEDQEELLDMVEPHIYRWAEIAERFNVEVFIPAEEANNMFVDEEYEGTDLCEPERKKMNEWMQEILPGIRERFSGKVGFATNDGGPCENRGDENSLEGPDFDYRGYDFAVLKFPFRSIFATDSEWDYYAEHTIKDSTRFIGRDGLDGLILYEDGDTVGSALLDDFAGSLPVRVTDENHQKESYEKDVQLLDTYDGSVEGLFFKISYAQLHEPSWNPFGRPAEQVLIETFGKDETIAVTELDEFWMSIGEDGIKAIQVCISEEIPFDPEYELDYDVTGDDEEQGEYHRLVERVRGLCME